MELDGMVAVVTGGSSGLGAAIVDRLASRGAHVVNGDLRDRDGRTTDGNRDAEDRDRDREDRDREIRKRISYHPLDVRDRDSWNALAATVRRTHGRLDLLVNNAGVSARRDLLDTTDDDWDNVLRTNLWAPWTGIRTFVDELTASPRAGVVNIGSIYGHLPPPPPPSPPSSVAYQVSKAGLHMLTRTAAVELAPRGIRVNSVLPGVFVTPLLQELPEEQLRPRVERAPMRRPGDPADVAAAVCYLASADASFVTGVLLPVDGGYIAS